MTDGAAPTGRKRKAMKPVKVWAHVDPAGVVTWVGSIGDSKRVVDSLRSFGERTVRVEIREVQS